MSVLKYILEKVDINHKKLESMIVHMKIINFKKETLHLEIIVKSGRLFFGEKCFTFAI